MERKKEMSIQHITAGAEATQDADGKPTVAVTAVHTGGGSTWRNRVHLTETAAQELLTDLLRLVEPAKPRRDVRVVFTDGQSAEFTNVAAQRHGDRYHLAHLDDRHVWIERRDVSFVEIEPHRPE